MESKWKKIGKEKKIQNGNESIQLYMKGRQEIKEHEKNGKGKG